MTDLIESLVRGLGLGGLYAVLGVSFVIVYRATGVINFATPALMILGAFFTGSFGNAIGLPFWLSVLLGMAVIAFIMVVIVSLLAGIVTMPIRMVQTALISGVTPRRMAEKT